VISIGELLLSAFLVRFTAFLIVRWRFPSGETLLSLVRNNQVTKAKSVFPTDDSLFKMLYLAMKDITKKWTGRRQDWSRIYAQLVIYYGDRIPE